MNTLNTQVKFVSGYTPNVAKSRALERRMRQCLSARRPSVACFPQCSRTTDRHRQTHTHTHTHKHTLLVLALFFHFGESSSSGIFGGTMQQGARQLPRYLPFMPSSPQGHVIGSAMRSLSTSGVTAAPVRGQSWNLVEARAWTWCKRK